MKTRHKITLLFALLVTAILLVVSFSVYSVTSFERKEIFKKRLKSRALGNAQLFSYFPDSSKAVLNRINSGAQESLPDKSVGIYNDSGKTYYDYNSPSAEQLLVDKEVFGKVISEGEYFFQVGGGREALALHYSEGGASIIVVVASYDKDGWMQLRRLSHIFLIVLLMGAAIALIAGHVFSKQLLKPVARIIREVRDISSHHFSRRIETGETQDELNQLAATFNELLDRLQESFNSQRRFISDASHELSTPLTSISSQLQVTLQRDRELEEYRSVMLSVQEDVVQMRQLTKSLLEIARTGTQGGIELNEVRIDEVLFKVMADIKKANKLYMVELQFSNLANAESNFLVFGNSDLLYIAIKNIVENGCKFSRDQTSSVNFSFATGQAIIDVSSKGEVIAEDEKERIFQPFYRSRSAAGAPGFGLGLALAKRIIAIHKGSIDVSSDQDSGAVFRIKVPAVVTKS